jgi:acylphosphatase
MITSKHMSKARVRTIIRGRVQGVFFRQHIRQKAAALGISGWVINRSDGAVEALFEGEKADIEKIVHWCHRGPSQAEVTDVQTAEEDYTGEFRDFTVRY